MDPLIKLLKEKPEVLKILGSAWDILYIEGRSPDVGKRRENFIRLLFEKELGLKVNVAPSNERGWDISIMIGGEERKYSIKTSDDHEIIKVAWNGNPSLERAEKYEFIAPILYVVRDRSKNEISVFVFELDDIEKLKEELEDDMWWIPKRETNPRGFGLSRKAVKELIEKAKQKNNYVSSTCKPVDIEKVDEDYWKSWYNLIKNLVDKYAQLNG